MSSIADGTELIQVQDKKEDVGQIRPLSSLTTRPPGLSKGIGDMVGSAVASGTTSYHLSLKIRVDWMSPDAL